MGQMVRQTGLNPLRPGLSAESGAAGGPVWPRFTEAGGEVLEFGVDGVQVRPDFAKPRLDWVESVAAITAR